MFILLLFLGAIGWSGASVIKTVWSLYNTKTKKSGKKVVKKMTSGQKVLSYLPIGNMCMLHYSYEGSYDYTPYVAIVLTILYTFRIVTMLIATIGANANNIQLLASIQYPFLYSYIGMLIAIVGTWLFYAWEYIRLSRQYNYSTLHYIATILLPFFTGAFMQNTLKAQVTAMNKQLEESERFEGNG